MAFRGAPVGHPLKTVSRKDKMDETPEITPEMQAVIDAAIADQTKKLNDKNAQLRDEMRELKAAKTEKEAELKKANNEAMINRGDWDALKKDLEKEHASALKTLQDEIATLTAENTTFKVDSVIAKAFADGGVKPDLHEVLGDAFKLRATAKNLSGDDLAKYISDEINSDKGKAWVAAPVNIGTGATGVKKDANPGGFTKENFNSKMGEWAALSASDPAQAKQIAESVGRSDLANSL